MMRVDSQKAISQILLTLSLLVYSQLGVAQCIDKDKVTYGGDWDFTNYIHRCPTYQFAYGGTESKDWGVLDDPVSMAQAPAIIWQLKQLVEDSIRHYAGEKFAQQLHFESVEMVVPEQLRYFKKEGRQDVTLKYCKAKYFFYYEFKPDSLATYHYGVAIDKQNKIVSPFVFPKARDYQPVDLTFSYCQLLRVAEQAQPAITPVETIRLVYDKQEKRFYWLISQEIQNQHAGINHYNQVLIDAANLSKTKLQLGEATIEY